MPASSYTSSASALITATVATVTAPDIDEVQFPPDISEGAVGGEMWATIVVAGSSGKEQRNSLWDVPRMHWEVSQGLRTPTQGLALKSFWLNRQGKARGFRFKNWDDYQATNEPLVPTGAPTVQLIKSYSDGVFSMVRNIFKPQENLTALTLRRNTVNYASFALDTTTGIVTMTADASFSISAITKASSAVITVTGHTFSAGQVIYIDGVNGMTEINGQTAIITATGANTITVPIDSTGYSTYTAAGTVAKYIQPSEVLDWSGEFDIPARFDTDSLRLSLVSSQIREWNDIPVVELIA
jgi:uncharacterized protein (TIGR02217 family)